LLPKSRGIITELQKEILKAFSRIPDSSAFYLTGGTALAEFYLAHRKSYDLDLFTTERGIVIPFSYAFEEETKKAFSLKVIRRFETFVEFEVSDKRNSTKVQLALDSSFRFEEPMRLFEKIPHRDVPPTSKGTNLLLTLFHTPSTSKGFRGERSLGRTFPRTGKRKATFRTCQAF